MTDTPANQAPTLGGVAPYLSLSDAAAAAEFYKAAFGAVEVARMAVDDGRLMHCHLHINGQSIMLSDAFPEHGHPLVPPQAFNLVLLLPKDVDAWWARAVDAGCTVTQPLQLMFWGDRYGALKDPFGVSWAMNAPAAA